MDFTSPDLMVIGALFGGALAHWFLEAYRDQSISTPELKSLPTIVVMVLCVIFVSVFDDPTAAFFAGYAIDSVFKNLFRIKDGEE